MDSEENDIYLGATFVLVSIIGIVGNVITLLILKRDDDFRAMNNSRLTMGNLAVIDLLFSTGAMISAIGYIDKQITSNTFVCKITSRIVTIQVPLTYTSHALLALHRLQSLKAFGGHQQARPGFLSSWKSVVTVWIISLIFACLLNIKQIHGSIKYYPQRGQCEASGWLTGTIYGFIAMTSMIIVFTSYLRIYRLVKSANRQIREQTEATDAGERVLKHRLKKITKVLFVIFTVLLACNIPYIAVDSLSEKFHISLVWQRITFLILMTNYANNFFIYDLMDGEYRKQLKKLFKCK